MCGIIGFVRLGKYGMHGNLRSRYIKQGLIIDTLRGDDGAGVFFPKKNGIMWVKKPSHGYSLVMDPAFADQATHIDDAWFCAAHNRSATVGELSIENTHPFAEGGVTLIHNGTLRGDGGLAKKQSDLQVDVDSHALCHNIAEAEPDGVTDVLSKINGAFALAWHDSRDGSFNLARNYERPLAIFEGTEKGNYFFASEREMVDLLNARLRLGAKFVKELPPHEVWKFKETSVEPEVSKFSPFRYSYQGYHQTGAAYGGTCGLWDEYDTEGWVPGNNGAYWRRRPESLPAPAQNVGAGENKPDSGGNEKSKHTTAEGKEASDKASKPAAGTGSGIRTRKVDPLMVAALKFERLDPEDRMLVVPTEKRIYTPSRGLDKALVVGFNRTMGLTVIFHGLLDDTVTNTWEQVWQARPIGINYFRGQGANYAPVVIGQLTGVRGSNLRGPEFEHFKYDTTPPVTLLGPNGHRYTRAGWRELIKGGCAWCGTNLSWHTPSDISWFNATPVCKKCVDGYQSARERAEEVQNRVEHFH